MTKAKPECRVQLYPGLDELLEKMIYEPVGIRNTPVRVKYIFYILGKPNEGLSIFPLAIAVAA